MFRTYPYPRCSRTLPSPPWGRGTATYRTLPSPPWGRGTATRRLPRDPCDIFIGMSRIPLDNISVCDYSRSVEARNCRPDRRRNWNPNSRRVLKFLAIVSIFNILLVRNQEFVMKTPLW